MFRLETICPQLSPQRFYFLSIPLVTWKMGSWRYFINCLTQRCPYCIIRTIVNSNLFFCLPALSETVVLNLWDTSKEKGGSQWRHFYLPRFRKGFFIHYVASKKTIFKYCLDFKLFGWSRWERKLTSASPDQLTSQSFQQSFPHIPQILWSNLWLDPRFVHLKKKQEPGIKYGSLNFEMAFFSLAIIKMQNHLCSCHNELRNAG